MKPAPSFRHSAYLETAAWLLTLAGKRMVVDIVASSTPPYRDESAFAALSQPPSLNGTKRATSPPALLAM